MKVIFIYTLLFFSLNCFAQEKVATSYLVVRIETQKDYSMERYGCSIIAEGGCDSARAIYNLKKYNFKKNAANNESSFYYNHADTATAYYNFFQSPTEALNFMAKNGWTLFYIYSETSSGWEVEKNGSGSESFPITTISSKPVFYFKK